MAISFATSLFSRETTRRKGRDIEKWQSAPVFCTGCFESDATHSRTHCLRACYNTRSENSRRSWQTRQTITLQNESKKEKDDIAYTGRVFQLLDKLQNHEKIA